MQFGPIRLRQEMTKGTLSTTAKKMTKVYSFLSPNQPLCLRPQEDLALRSIHKPQVSHQALETQQRRGLSDNRLHHRPFPNR